MIAAPAFRKNPIRRSPDSWIGDGIYNTTGVDQTASRDLARGAKGTFLVKAQNYGSGVDRLLLKGCSSDAVSPSPTCPDRPRSRL